jgi:isopropylmalate/homocitrate/citramalate synthase
LAAPVAPISGGRLRQYPDALAAETPAVTIFGNLGSSRHGHSDNFLEENLDMIRDSVAFLKTNNKEVIYDAEHFFDGYKKNRHYALQTSKRQEKREPTLLFSVTPTEERCRMS